jgi:hypothetical protein
MERGIIVGDIIRPKINQHEMDGSELGHNCGDIIRQKKLT